MLREFVENMIYQRRRYLKIISARSILMSIIISVPGKIHIIGEHAVVYGEPAILAAIGKRLEIRAEKMRDNRNIEIRSREIGNSSFDISEAVDFARDCQKLWNDGFEKKDFFKLFQLIKGDKFNPIKVAIGKAMIELGISNTKDSFSLDISSDIPMGSGLGSSSALSVGIAATISELYQKQLSKEQINNLSFKIEQLFHGTPSGADNTTCCFGGLVWFQKAQPRDIIISLRDEIPHKLENFVLVWTRKPEMTTGELVQIVRNLPESFREPRIKEIGKLVYEMKTVLKAKNYARMKDIINRNQQLLAELGVSCDEIDTIAEAVRKIGGAAKLCGAGGGGTMLCWHEDKELLNKEISNLGFESIETDLGENGILSP